MHKDIKKLLRDIEAKGWTWHYAGRHIKAHLGKQIVSMFITPSCCFAVRNIEGDIRRAERRHYETLKGGKHHAVEERTL